MKTRLLLIIITLFGYISSHGQWYEMMFDENSNFFQIRDSFEKAFENVANKKGTGWKQFKRWEYYHQFRVDSVGNFPPPGHVLTEIEEYYRSHPQTKTYAIGTGNWELLGPVTKPVNGTGQPNGNGRLSCITFHPTDPNAIFVGAPSGGFWKTTDGGDTWTQYVTGLTRLGISSIVIDPTSPNTIYIGTGDRDGGVAPGYGVWRSTDGGLTWSPRNTGMCNRTVNEILMNPSNPSNLIASSGNRIYRSTDAGANWTFVTVSSNMKDIAFKPGDPNTIYGSGTSFELSTNNGVSFTNITSGVPAGSSRIALAVSAAQPNYIYLLAGNGSGLVGLYRSTDSGLNFSTRSTAPNILGYSNVGSDANSQAWYDLVLAADPANADVLYAGGINIWKSTDGGTTWSIMAHWTGSGADDVHADQHVLEFSPHNGFLYNGNDGGIYVTSDGGTNWNELSSGLAIAQVYKIGVAQSIENTVINGYQDNGTAIYYDGPLVTEIGGDGMECIIDPTDASYMYGALYYGDIRRSTNNGANFSTITNGITESGGWVTPYKLDPNSPERMFIGYKNIWKSDDVKSPAANAVVWTRISNFGGTSNIIDLAIAPSNSNVMYVSRGGATTRFFKTTDALAASPTWTNLTASLPAAASPKDIEIDPTNPDHLFVAINNDIYESIDGGNTWTNFSGTLPNISVNTIVIDPASPLKAMYLGMDVGVYYRDNTMSDWSMYSTGLTNVEITELEIYNNPTECKSKLFASTYGMGLWTSDLKDPGNVAPIACFEASRTDVCAGQTISFTSLSSFTPTSWTWTVSPATFTYMNGTNANSENPDIRFTAADTYTVSLTVTNAFGSDLETKAAYITVSAAANASTFNEDFESFALCPTVSDCGITNCSISGKWNNLTNGSQDNIDWRIDEAGTTSANTGPTVDFNPGTATGNYAYLEASSCSGNTGILESECVFLDQDYELRLGYHMFGADMGSFHIDLYNGNWIEDIIPAYNGDQGNSWRTATVDLSAYTGETVKLRFRGITGSGFTSDMAIDDIRFTPITFLSSDFKDIKANCENNSVSLTWSVSNTDKFEIFSVQKYDLALNSWKELASVKSENRENFNFDDTDILKGENLYRIEKTNASGDKTISSMVAANCKLNVSDYELYPNPFKDFVTLSIRSSQKLKLNYRITNLLGQVILTSYLNIENGNNSFNIDLKQLPKGVYLLKLDDPSAATFRIIKLD